MTNEALSKFIDHLAKSAPHVWQGMVSYHRAQAVTALVITVAAYVCLATCMRIVIKMIREDKSSVGEGKILPSFLLAGVLIAGAFLGQSTPQRVAEVTWPERAAALDMIEQIKKVPK